MTINKKTKVITVGVALLLAVGLLALFFVVAQNKQESNKDNSSNKQEAVDPIKEVKKLNQVPEAEHLKKTACTIVAEQLAAEAIGQTAKQTLNQPVVHTDKYISSSCEYTAGGAKLTVFLYAYPSKEEAEQNKDKIPNEIVLTDRQGKTTKKSIADSVTEVKDKYILSVSIASNGSFDEEASESLLSKAVGRL